MPSIEVDDWFKLILFRLVKAGYGTARELLKTPTDIVLGMVYYENFVAQYEGQVLELNKKE